MLETIQAPKVPRPLGNYSHAVAYKDLLFVCGMGPRHPVTNEVPGLSTLDGRKLAYDVRAETKATLENIQEVLKAAGSDLEHVIEVNVFLTDMADFTAMNEVYSTFFPKHWPARTTVGVASLPGNISVEIKVVAVRNSL